MSENAKRWGGFTILSGLGATLVAGFIAWLANTTIENKVTFTPIVSAIERLTDSMQAQEVRAIKRDKDKDEEHKILVEKLSIISSRIVGNEVKLFRVIADCNENHYDIKKCKELKNQQLKIGQ